MDTYTLHYGPRGSNHLGLLKDLQQCDRVFVYGTLKKTYGNHSVLGGSTYLTTTDTVSSFVLGDIGYPYAFPYDSVPSAYTKLLFPIRGEVYKIDDEYSFAGLDGLEGYPSHYNRRIISTKAGLSAWMYVQEDWSLAEYCSACKLKEGVWQWPGN